MADLREFTRKRVDFFNYLKKALLNIQPKGSFHQGHAAFKFIKMAEKDFNSDSTGSHEYVYQEKIKSVKLGVE